MMKARMPKMANGEESTAKKDIPKTPATPNTTLTVPKTLPKAGVLSMATPRRINPIEKTANPTVSVSLNMPWVACHKRTSVACYTEVAPGA